MGFGHRVYKNYDPRARVIKKYADQILHQLHVNDPILDIAIGLESTAIKDEYFAKRKLFPNVDFYSGIIYRTLGIPVNMCYHYVCVWAPSGLDFSVERNAGKS